MKILEVSGNQQNHLDGLWKKRLGDPTPRVWDLRIGPSNKMPLVQGPVWEPPLWGWKDVSGDMSISIWKIWKVQGFVFVVFLWPSPLPWSKRVFCSSNEYSLSAWDISKVRERQQAWCFSQDFRFRNGSGIGGQGTGINIRRKETKGNLRKSNSLLW